MLVKCLYTIKLQKLRWSQSYDVSFVYHLWCGIKQTNQKQNIFSFSPPLKASNTCIHVLNARFWLVAAHRPQLGCSWAESKLSSIKRILRLSSLTQTVQLQPRLNQWEMKIKNEFTFLYSWTTEYITIWDKEQIASFLD